MNDSKYVDFLKAARNFGAVYSMEKADMKRNLSRVVHDILSGRLENGRQYHPYC